MHHLAAVSSKSIKRVVRHESARFAALLTVFAQEISEYLIIFKKMASFIGTLYAFGIHLLCFYIYLLGFYIDLLKKRF